MDGIDTWETIKNIAAGLGAIAVIITSLGIIHTKVIGPWLARPISDAINERLEDAVEAIILSDRIVTPLKDIMEEVVASETREIIRLLQDHDDRLTRIEGYFEALPKRRGDEVERRRK